MKKEYNGDKLAIIIDFLLWSMAIYFMFCLSNILLDILLDRQVMAWRFFALITIIGTGILTIMRLVGLKIIFDSEQIMSIYNGPLLSFYWKKAEKISYIPILLQINVWYGRSSIQVSPIIKNYKQAWRDIVLQAQESNPNIIISPKLIKKLQKENLL